MESLTAFYPLFEIVLHPRLILELDGLLSNYAEHGNFCIDAQC